MSRWLAMLLILASGDVWAHRFAPSLPDIRQIADTTFSATENPDADSIGEPIEPNAGSMRRPHFTLGSGGTGMLMQIGLT